MRGFQNNATTWNRVRNVDGELELIPGSPYRATQWHAQFTGRLAVGWAF